MSHSRLWIHLVFMPCALGWIGPASAWAQAAGGLDEGTLRRNLAWQLALDAKGFSPGLIDGSVGPKTRLATSEFQRVRGLPPTGELDPATAAALAVAPDDALARYTIQPEDLEQIGPVPDSWNARSKLQRLGHPSLLEVIAERFQCKRDLLGQLNPGVNIARLKAGDKVIVPAIQLRKDWPQAAQLEVSLEEKVIRVIDNQRRLIALFHCSIAADKAKRPSRDTEIISVVPDPWYTFDPKKWPEVKERVASKLQIPPGPRNPVGRVWMGLGLPGYGMHGTPNPELIGKTGSHGCFRLANWDAQRLSSMVRVGTPVRFIQQPGAQVASR